MANRKRAGSGETGFGLGSFCSSSKQETEQPTKTISVVSDNFLYGGPPRIITRRETVAHHMSASFVEHSSPRLQSTLTPYNTTKVLGSYTQTDNFATTTNSATINSENILTSAKNSKNSALKPSILAHCTQQTPHSFPLCNRNISSSEPQRITTRRNTEGSASFFEHPSFSITPQTLALENTPYNTTKVLGSNTQTAYNFATTTNSATINSNKILNSAKNSENAALKPSILAHCTQQTPNSFANINHRSSTTVRTAVQPATRSSSQTLTLAAVHTPTPLSAPDSSEISPEPEAQTTSTCYIRPVEYALSLAPIVNIPTNCVSVGTQTQIPNSGCSCIVTESDLQQPVCVCMLHRQLKLVQEQLALLVKLNAQSREHMDSRIDYLQKSFKYLASNAIPMSIVPEFIAKPPTAETGATGNQVFSSSADGLLPMSVFVAESTIMPVESTVMPVPHPPMPVVVAETTIMPVESTVISVLHRPVAQPPSHEPAMELAQTASYTEQDMEPALAVSHTAPCEAESTAASGAAGIKVQEPCKAVSSEIHGVEVQEPGTSGTAATTNAESDSDDDRRLQHRALLVTS